MLKSDYIEVQSLNVDEALKGKISIYPNPTKGDLNISIQDGNEISVEVFDILGRRVKYLSSIKNNHQPIVLDLSSEIVNTQMLIVKITVDGNTGNYKVLTMK